VAGKAARTDEKDGSELRLKSNFDSCYDLPSIYGVIAVPRPNPMSGPAYIIALRNALEQRPATEYQSPPRTGGTQVSIRLDEFIFNHVEAITAKTEWNRAEVLHALIQRGLFDLYEFCRPEVVDALVQDVVAKLAPPHPPAVGPVGPFVIESESEADDYLRDLLEKPEYRSMGEVQMRAQKYIKDNNIRKYFVKKAKETLKA
jgi:hypothetical protein